ncbi:MAG: hypothetical protein NVSMB62_24790 [Acidobacteriaceae bacterium]
MPNLRPAHAALLALVIALPALAQTAPEPTPTAPLAWDTVSIHPNPDGCGTRCSIRVQGSPDGFTATNLTPHSMILTAFDVNEDQLLNEPSWTRSSGYNIQARVAESDIPAYRKLTDLQHRAMYGPILTERFQLRTHRESRVLPVYLLTVAKSGPKLTAAASDLEHPDQTSISVNNESVTAKHIAIAGLLPLLSRITGRSVIDKTGLTGAYDITLHYSRDDAPQTPDSPPSIFTALQEQLGLKLEASKAPSEVVVVDHIEQPSEN